MLGSTFEREVQNSLSMLEPSSMDSLGHQHHAKKLSPKIALHFKVLCESKATLPITTSYVRDCGILTRKTAVYVCVCVESKQLKWKWHVYRLFSHYTTTK